LLSGQELLLECSLIKENILAKHAVLGLDALDEIFDVQEFYGEVDCGG
jgi:hypothetical protein